MKKIKIIILCNLLILFTMAFCAFCADANKPTAQTLPSTPKPVQPPAQAPSPPQILPAPANPYNYNPFGKPDPFKPFVDIEIAAVKQEKKASKTESIFPLQRVSVESFNLVGIIGDQTRRVAVVEDSAKKFYPIFVGTRIGLQNGKVSDILADRIIVDELDGKKVKKIILKLRKNI
jgi:type IV pilus assembly protein PilP